MGAAHAQKLGVIPRTTARLEQWMAALPRVATLYVGAYRDVIRREAALAGIEADDRVLNIGCGAAPFTALLLARETGALITALDHDHRAVKSARRMVRRCGLGRQVKVRLGEASDGVPPFDVAVLALQVTPKRPVLAALASRAAPHARLIVRHPADWCEGMYDALGAEVAPLAEVRHHKGAFDRSALYRAGDVRDVLRKVGPS